MSTVQMLAIEPCNSHRPGDRFEVSEREAEQLRRKGLAKPVGPSSNKMLPPPANKAHPSPAAGKDAPSSASPAAPASPLTTARPSTPGATPRRAVRKTFADQASTAPAEGSLL